MQMMDTWQIALLGFLGLLSLGVLQFFIQNFMTKKTKLEDEKLDRIMSSLKTLDNNITEMRKDIGKITMTSVINGERITELNNRVEKLERRMDQFERDFNKYIQEHKDNK